MKKFLTVLTAVPLAVGLGALGTGAANADSDDFGSLSDDVGIVRSYDGPLDDALGSLDDLVPDDLVRQINGLLGQFGVQIPVDVDDDWDDDRWDDDDNDDRWDD